MIRVIGNANCVNCKIAKQTLEKKGIEFSYELFNDLSEKEQIMLSNMASEKHMMKMPLILKDNELTTLADMQKEIVNE